MKRFHDNPALCAELAARVASDLAAAIDARRRATLAVSGGSTPGPLFDALCQAPLDWSRVQVTLVDERWVAEDDAASNARLVRDRLLQQRAAAAQFVGLKTAAARPADAQAEVARRLAAFMPSIDVVLLGMGEDGHTASFFPGAAQLDSALSVDADAICAALVPPAAPHPRMTLTLGALLRARHRYLHIVGAAKLAVLERALAAGDAREMPVRAVLHAAQAPTEIYYAEGN